MKEGLHLEELGEIPFDEKEILRYAMLPSFAPPPEELPLTECLETAKGAAQCRAVWCRYPLKRDGEWLDLGFARTDSRDLRNHLEGCGEILLFACTAGAEMDRRIARARIGQGLQGSLTVRHGDKADLHAMELGVGLDDGGHVGIQDTTPLDAGEFYGEGASFNAAVPSAAQPSAAYPADSAGCHGR